MLSGTGTHLSITLEGTAAAGVVVSLPACTIANVGIEDHEVDAREIGGEVRGHALVACVLGRARDSIACIPGLEELQAPQILPSSVVQWRSPDNISVSADLDALKPARCVSGWSMLQGVPATPEGVGWASSLDSVS